MINNFSYPVVIDQQLEDNVLDGEFYLVILHASRVPPHIGLITEGCYYSLSIKGQELNIPLEPFLKNLRIRRIPSLFLRINSDTPNFRDSVIEEISKYPRVVAGESTCLSPVKKIFERNFDIASAGINYIFDLLPILANNNRIGKVYSLNIEGKIAHLPIYTHSDIEREIIKANIEALEIKKR